MKTLKLTFSTANKRNYTTTIENAKEDLTLDEAKAAAAKLMKVLENHSGIAIAGMGLSAEFIT